MGRVPERVADLKDPEVLRGLLSSPESDVVERKRAADIATLAKVVSAFANANGGWLLLGVDDDGALAGWHPNGRAHPRDWLRDVLDNALDPVPHFEAELFDVDGTTIGIVRVPRSTAAPHFIDATGEVFERRNGQTKRAISSQVRQMTLRGSDGTDVARGRLDDRKIAPDLTIALDAPRKSTSMHARALASIVRVSLLETSDGFRDWVHSAEARARSHTFIWSAARAMNDRDWCAPPRPAPARTTAGGHTAAAEWDGRMLREINVAWDRVGLGGVRLAGERPDDSGIFYLLSNEVRDRWLVTGLEYLFDALDEAGAFGPAVLRWNLHGIRGADVTTVRDRNVVAAQGVIPAHYDNMVELDTQVDIGVIGASGAADQLWRLLERLSGAEHH
jgi:hypothetical protein